MWDLGACRNCQRKCSAKRVEILVEKGGNIGGKGGKRVEIIGGNGSLGKGWKLRRYGVLKVRDSRGDAMLGRRFEDARSLG